MYSGLVSGFFLFMSAMMGVHSVVGLEEQHEAQIVARQDTGALSSIPPASQTSLPPATISPILFFKSISQFTTCSSGSIAWEYAGPSAPMTLIVTNDGIGQDDPPTQSSTSSHINTFTNGGIIAAVPTGASIPNVETVTFALSTSIDPYSLSFQWNPVNITQGWYAFYASLTNPPYQSMRSFIFFVQQGGDNSCLVGPTNSGSSSTGAPSSTSSQPAASSAPVAAPIGGASSSSSKVGVIVGVVIGGTALLTAVILAYFCLQRKGKRSPFGSGGPTGSRGWGGLGSGDASRASKGGRKSKVYAGGRYQRSNSQADSLGPIVTGSEEAFSPSVEKFSSTSTPGHEHSATTSPFDDSAGVMLSTMPAVSQTGPASAGRPGASRTYSYSSYTTNEYTPNSSRRPSMPDSAYLYPGGGRPSLDSNTYPPSSPAYPSGTSAALQSSITAQPHYYNPYINPELARSQAVTLSSSSNVQVNSSQPTPKIATTPGTQSSARKTPRKPVPVYDPTSVALQQSTVSLPASPPERSPAESPVSHEMFNFSNGSQSHYTTRSNSQPGVHREPQLQHKSSFGPGGVEGKPLHYLIPDMPLDMTD